MSGQLRSFCDGCGGRGSPRLGVYCPAWGEGALTCLHGCSWALCWHLAFGGGSWAPGSGLGGPGAQVESRWAAVQPLAWCQPLPSVLYPPICRCRRARRPSGPLRPLGLRVWGRQSRVFCRPGDWGARAGHTTSCCLPQAFRVEGLGGTGQGGRVYPGLAVGLAGGRGVRTEGLCGPAIGELLAGTWTQRHVHLTSPAVSTSEMDQQVWARPQCAAGA